MGCMMKRGKAPESISVSGKVAGRSKLLDRKGWLPWRSLPNVFIPNFRMLTNKPAEHLDACG